MNVLLTGANGFIGRYLQIRIRDMSSKAAAIAAPLPSSYGRCMRLWFGLGWPAFAAVIATFWLMVDKPDLW